MLFLQVDIPRRFTLPCDRRFRWVKIFGPVDDGTGASQSPSRLVVSIRHFAGRHF